MGTELRGIDPNKHFGPRLASRLEGHYQSRSLYTVAVANCKRLGQNEPLFKKYARWDHLLLSIHCLLKWSAFADYVLQRAPPAAQGEVGLPGSERVGGAAPSPAKRPRIGQVAINGMDGLTDALAGMAQAIAPASATTTAAGDIYDNVDVIIAVTMQLDETWWQIRSE